MRENQLIRNRDRIAQIVDFNGMSRHRGISPSDIDAIIDYNGCAFVIFECKFTGAGLPKGQRILLENLANHLPNAYVIVCEHNNYRGEIILKDCRVKHAYTKSSGWREIQTERTAMEAIERFEKVLTNKGIKL